MDMISVSRSTARVSLLSLSNSEVPGLGLDTTAPEKKLAHGVNYGGPLRKPDQIRKDNNLQLVATILVDVCYRVYGVAESLGGASNVNHAHALQGMFTRRLKQGCRLFYMPSLGWKEFIPTYFGPLRNDSKPEETVNFTLPAMLKSTFDAPVAGRYAPVYLVNAQAEKGILYYDGKPGGRYAG